MRQLDEQQQEQEQRLQPGNRAGWNGGSTLNNKTCSCGSKIASRDKFWKMEITDRGIPRKHSDHHSKNRWLRVEAEPVNCILSRDFEVELVQEVIRDKETVLAEAYLTPN
jgi:hypothetical protein